LGDFAFGRACLRQLLSAYGAVGPGEWVFENGPQGKPALVAPAPVPGLQFNLSHSGRWLAIALSTGVEVGVDVQRFDDDRPLRSLARRYFSEPERETLESLEGEDFNQHFFRLWALKEAWTKARGEALPTALRTTAFSLCGGELLSLNPEQTRDNSLWLMQLEGHALAVCGLARGLSLRCWRWSGPGTAAPFEPPLLAASGLS
jgi:4'-phosphopantetheinyl transferase